MLKRIIVMLMLCLAGCSGSPSLEDLIEFEEKCIEIMEQPDDLSFSRLCYCLVVEERPKKECLDEASVT